MDTDRRGLDAILLNLPDPRRENLGLGYLASTLKQQGRRVEIFQPRAVPASPPGREETCLPELLERDASVLGISLYALGADEAARLIQAVRRARPGVHICLGGHLPTVACREILQDPDLRVDSIVLGEGERTFAELVERVCEGGDWRRLPGIAYGQAGSVVVNPPATLEENLDRLPFPLRIGTDSYGREVHSGARICSARGCYADCAFCSVRAFYASTSGKAWRGRSAENVVDEIEHLVRSRHLSAFEFVDDNFLGPGRLGRTRAVAIAHEIERRGLRITFAVACRADDVAAADLSELVRAGLKRVFVGIESGTQHGLDTFNKRLTVEDNEKALILLRRLQLQVRVGFIFFFPQMTLDDVTGNLNFLEKIGHWGAVPDSAGFNSLQVLHGTPIQRSLLEQGRLRGSYRHYEADYLDPDVALLHAFMQQRWYELHLELCKSLGGTAESAVRKAIAGELAAYPTKLHGFLLRACRRAVFHLRGAASQAAKEKSLEELARKLEVELYSMQSNIARLREASSGRVARPTDPRTA